MTIKQPKISSLQVDVHNKAPTDTFASTTETAKRTTLARKKRNKIYTPYTVQPQMWPAIKKSSLRERSVKEQIMVGLRRPK